MYIVIIQVITKRKQFLAYFYKNQKCENKFVGSFKQKLRIDILKRFFSKNCRRRDKF